MLHALELYIIFFAFSTVLFEVLISPPPHCSNEQLAAELRSV
jgi:hypothetical protein